MSNIIRGEELSCWRTIGIAICQSKKENRDGVRSRYIILTVKDKKSIASKSKKVMLFEEDIPGAIDKLKGFADEKTITTRTGTTKYYQVDMARLKADEAGRPGGELYDYLEFPGGCVEEYEFQKGWCYGNDDAGKRIKDVNQQDVKKDRISVFVQVDYKEPDGNGGFKTKYISGMGLYDVGPRLEARFWKDAVNPTAPTVTQPEDKVPDDPTSMNVDDF